MKEMFKGKVNSPATLLVETIDSSVTSIKVADGTVFPEGPNVAVIGTDGNAETIKYESINGNILVGCVRGFQGKASVWDKDTIIARNFTEYDLDTLQENILELDKKQLKDFKDDENHRLITDEDKLKIHGAIKGVSKIINGDYSINLEFTNYDEQTTTLLLNNANTRRSGLMSTVDKKKLDGIAEGANKVTKLSELENDTTFKTESEIQELINNSTKLKKEVVTSLTTTGKDDVIYLVQDPKGKDNNNYLEYLWLNGKYELIGSTQVDLSGYAKTSTVTQMQSQLGVVEGQLNHKLDKGKDKAIAPQNIDDFELELTVDDKYVTPKYISGYVRHIVSGVGDIIQEEVDKKLNKSDIQEFTQQELEEAFK